jgi:hypothetical protein
MMSSNTLPPAPPSEHFDRVLEAILKGNVVPFLGAGANLCGHDESEWDPDCSPRLPLGGELARHLAGQVGYEPRSFKAACVCHKRNKGHEFQEVIDDLLRISQYVQLKKDEGFLYDSLDPLFDRDYTPTALHWLLANLPAKLAEQGRDNPHILVVSTNYDDIMERAFELAGEPYDVVYYTVSGPRGVNFIHKSRDGKVEPVQPNTTNVSLKHGSVVFKIHGGVQRRAGADDLDEIKAALDYPSSYVITEDNYIDYLSRVNFESLPVVLRKHMVYSNFLFLGYSLRDWNLRAFLHSIWDRSHVERKSWAIQRGPEPLDVDFWRNRRVEIFDADLRDYASKLCRRLRVPEMPAAPPETPAAGGARGEATTP